MAEKNGIPIYETYEKMFDNARLVIVPDAVHIIIDDMRLGQLPQDGDVSHQVLNQTQPAFDIEEYVMKDNIPYPGDYDAAAVLGNGFFSSGRNTPATQTSPLTRMQIKDKGHWITDYYITKGGRSQLPVDRDSSRQVFNHH